MNPRSVLWLPLVVAVACSKPDSPSGTNLGGTASNEHAATAPTFARDVAPIVYRSCSPCHRPGQPAPFTLLSYADVHRRQKLIVEVTQQRVMPPWLMTHGEFAGDRRLTAAEIETLRGWVEGGAPRGDEASEPPPPQFASGWQLREPDLIVTAPQALRVPASGPNVFRNLVIPAPVSTLRHVEAIEIRPNSPAVHHAVLAVDSTQKSRGLDALDEEPGFPGMAAGGALPPDGHFVGWTPGKQVRRNPRGMAWRLRPGQDMVLQLHLVPTGKPETVLPKIGLYFTDLPTTIEPYPLVLWNDQIDLTPGVTDFVIRDHVTVSVPFTLLGVYPHAHYLCRRMSAWATAPDGKKRVLFGIDEWDFDWQDDYLFDKPVELAAGTTLSMEYHYDNSDGNPNNPHRPPVHVRFGQASEDEMGTLTMMVTVANHTDRLRLAEACHVRDAEKCPSDARLLQKLGGIRREMGKLEEAIATVQRAMQLGPDDPEGYYELGMCHERGQRIGDAESAYAEVLRRDPGHGGANLQLGGLLARSGRTEAAFRHFEAALVTLPNLPLLHCNLGTAHLSLGQLSAAERRYRQALALEERYPNALFLLGRTLLAQSRKAEAREVLLRALQLRPGDAAMQKALEEAR